MKRIKRASIILIAVALVVSLTMVLPASAQNSRERVDVLSSEFVVCTLESSGEIEEVQVFNQLSLDGNGKVAVRQEKAFEDVGGFQGVKGFATPKVEGDFIVWPEISVNGPANVLASTKLSEPMVEEARTRIPLKVEYTYWFNGERITDLETITGKSGSFSVELKLTNTSKEKTEIEYRDPSTGVMITEEVETYMPLVVLPYDWYFDNQVFFNLQADPTGTVVPMPDFYNVGWSIPLFPPATDESHTIWVKADVKDFQMPPLTLAVLFHFPETNQTDIKATLAPYIKIFYDGLKKVNAGIGSPETDPSLLFGINAIYNGMEKLAAAIPAMPEGLDTKIVPGIKQIVAGIGSETTDGTLLYANNAVTGGLQTISAGIGAPTADKTLLYAMSAMNAGLEQTKAGIGSATTDATLLYAVNAIQGGLSSIAAGIGAASTPDTLLFAVNAVQGGLSGILTGVGAMMAGIGSAATPGTLLNGLAQILGGVQTISAGLGASGQPGTIIDGLTTMANGINASIIPGLQGIQAALSPGAGLTTLYDYTLTVAKPITDAVDVNIWLNQQTMMGGYAVGLGTLIGAGGLGGIYTGLSTQIIPGLTGMKNAMDVQLIPGIQQVILGLSGGILPGLQSIATGIGSAVTPGTLLYAMAAIQGGLQGIQAGIGSPTTSASLLYAITAVQGGLLQIATGIGDAATADTLLYAVNAVEEGLEGIKAGIGDAGMDKTLLFATAAIQGGLHNIKEGLSSGDPSDPKILEGLVQITSGLNQVVTGIGSAGTPDTLLYGANAVKDGLTELGGGTGKLEGGLLQILTQFSMTDAELDVIAERGEEFDHFLGRAEDAKNQVRFVYQTKPTYNYKTGNSTGWIVAIVLSLIIALGLVAGGILLARRSSA